MAPQADIKRIVQAKRESLRYAAPEAQEEHWADLEERLLDLIGSELTEQVLFPRDWVKWLLDQIDFEVENAEERAREFDHDTEAVDGNLTHAAALRLLRDQLTGQL